MTAEAIVGSLYQAGIKNPVEFLKSKRPLIYDWLKGAFPRGVVPTDIDGIVELGGVFLAMEFKHEDTLRNNEMPLGQRRFYEALVSTRYFTVLLIGHDDRHALTCYELWYHTGAKKLLTLATDMDIYRLCNKWGQKADKGELKPV